MRKIFYTLLLIVLLSIPTGSFGFSIIKNISAPVTGQFSLSPIKFEFEINEGDIIKRELKIYNKTGVTSEFQIDLEDTSVEGITAIGGAKKIERYISVDNKKFTLDQGEEAIVVLTAKVPDNNVEKFIGGKVLVTRREVGSTDSSASQVIVRSGALIFINIGKIAIRSGNLSDFNYLGDGVFKIRFNNTGEAKLNPYGFIEFRNISGDLVERLKIEPWFVLPGDEREVEVKWKIPYSLSPLYGAHLVLYPGFGGRENTENVSLRIYDFYTIFAYVFFLIFLVIILIKFLKNGKK